MARLTIHLFGRMRVLRDGAAEAHITPVAQLLLAYLLVHPTFASRDTLACLHWCEAPQDQARSALNTALWRLRRCLEKEGRPGPFLLSAPSGDISFNWRSDHWLDKTTYERATNRVMAVPPDRMRSEDADELATGVRLYTGDLLAGLDAEWIVQERERMRLVHIAALQRLAAYMRTHARLDEGIAYGRVLLELDPLNEEMHRELMRMYAMRGDRVAALRQFEQCRQALQDELGIGPAQETVLLHQQIAAHASPVAGAHAAAPATAEFFSPELRRALAEVRDAARLLTDAQERLGRALALVECFADPRLSADVTDP